MTIQDGEAAWEAQPRQEFNADGLPMGVQCVAATHREDLLVRLGSQLEAAAPWSHRMPPLV